MPHATDLELSVADITGLTSVDAIAALFDRLGYTTNDRTELPPSALGFSESNGAVTRIELLAGDEDGFLRVVFVQVRSNTAKVRNAFVRALGKRNEDYLLILVADFDAIELVLIDKLKHRKAGPGGGTTYKPVAKTLSVNRRLPDRQTLRTLRRLTFTTPDGVAQYDKIRHAFEAATYSGRYFQNRALFADHYLEQRLPELAAWTDNPSTPFAAVAGLLEGAHEALLGKPESAVRERLHEPMFEQLGFKAVAGKPADGATPTADYILTDCNGTCLTAALVYKWDRWLDGPDWNDEETPSENPGAAVVSLLEDGVADWIIVTNGRVWRLYSAHAHSRSTNFYEVDLEEAMAVAAGTDPNEAFRYWWLFFRREAFGATEESLDATWLDFVAAESREYAEEVEEKLKHRVFEEVVPQLAAGFVAYRKERIKSKAKPTELELEDIRQATLTFLYRILFLLFAEARDLLPVRESAYHAISFSEIKHQIAGIAGPAETEADDRLAKKFKARSTELYDRLASLFAVMAEGDAAFNVPKYNGGLFLTKPPESSASTSHSAREVEIARFLIDNKIPDRYLATAIDRLARVPDEKRCELVFIDYKSMGVRQLGSVYEGLLEYKLAIAMEDLASKKNRGKETYIPLSKARGKSTRKRVEAVVRKGELYLTNDKAERKATGSYYTPDHIVEYIVEHTVGPVLDEKLEKLRPTFRKAEKTYHSALANARANPQITKSGLAANPRSPEVYAEEHAFQNHRDLIDRLFDLRILDPAMGSGHFLVEAVDFVTDRIIDYLNRFPRNPVYTGLARTRRDIVDAVAEQGVSIDPYDELLNDVHLLKRQVLKRCIYGVDLNPLACELAKVSLWLDAFTLGAPLSFLDHHLRPGNSLVGSSFVDLESATAEQLFGIDYEPLTRAIKNVLLISKLSDATAAEARQSAAGYAAARRELDTYRIVFDLLTAEHFGHSDAPKLITNAAELDLKSYDRFVRSLDDHEVSLVNAVEDKAHDLSFFHWELEFPEVFFTLGSAVGIPNSTQHLEARPTESRGFDAVVGNPPYVRQELLRAGKPFLKTRFAETFVATADIYVYFFQRELEIVRPMGRVGMIVTNKWLRTEYGGPLREYIKAHALPISMLDFGHTPVFPDADTFPVIPILERNDESANDSESAHNVRAVTMPRASYNPSMCLTSYMEANYSLVPVSLLSRNGWSLEPPEVQRLLAKLRTHGTPLAEACGVEPESGIKTGFNEAFVISESDRLLLIDEHATSQELIRPLLRGRDIERWAAVPEDCYMIVVASSENTAWPWSIADDPEASFREAYPAIWRHLSGHRDRLENRQDQGRYWWELRSCAYLDNFNLPKIVWQEMGWVNAFARDASSSIVLNTGYILNSCDPVVLATLNSSIAWWFMWRTAQHGKDEVLRLIREFVRSFPIPNVSNSLREQISEVVEEIESVVRSEQETQRLLDLEERLNDLVLQAFQVSAAERQIVLHASTPRDPITALRSRLGVATSSV